MNKLQILADENPLPESFNCSKCHHECHAICCSNVPLPEKLIKRNLKLIQQPILKMTRIADAVIPETENGKCPFLTKDYKCAIYKYRPPICKLFGTEIHPWLTCCFQNKNGVKRTINIHELF